MGLLRLISPALPPTEETGRNVVPPGRLPRNRIPAKAQAKKEAETQLPLANSCFDCGILGRLSTSILVFITELVIGRTIIPTFPSKGMPSDVVLN